MPTRPTKPSGNPRPARVKRTLMKLKILLTWGPIALGTVGIVLAAPVIVLLMRELPGASSYTKPIGVAPVELPQKNAPGNKAVAGLPVRLKIRSINVDAAVEYVGIAPDGAMAVPKGPDNVAWFNRGPRPGEPGSAVIAGHEGWKNGIPAVFDYLHKLQPGDKVDVLDDGGVTTTFVVREVRTYGEHEDAWSVFGINDGTARLNLVTCEGVWNKANRSYANRIVVFTEKE